MLESNIPYRRIDDGIGTGLVGGAVAGWALYGGASAISGFSAGRRMRKAGIDPAKRLERAIEGYEKYYKRKYNGKHPFLIQVHAGIKASHLSTNEAMSYLGDGAAARAAKFALGSSKSRAITKGVSILGGALAGGGIDYMSDYWGQ